MLSYISNGYKIPIRYIELCDYNIRNVYVLTFFPKCVSSAYTAVMGPEIQQPSDSTSDQLKYLDR